MSGFPHSGRGLSDVSDDKDWITKLREHSIETRLVFRQLGHDG